METACWLCMKPQRCNIETPDSIIYFIQKKHHNTVRSIAIKTTTHHKNAIKVPQDASRRIIPRKTVMHACDMGIQ
tara:strand:+ start:655 stop:879 length:225 start_codon:yes stop_codon:yes gene_type:complete